MRAPATTRAHKLLEECPHELIPYNFSREDFVCVSEGIDPTTAQHELALVSQKAQQVHSVISAGVHQDYTKYHQELMAEISAYPELVRAVENDSHRLEARVRTVGKRAQSRLKPIHGGSTDEEALVDDITHDLEDIFEVGGIESLAALRKMTFPTGILLKIRDLIIGVLGCIVVATINRIFFLVFISAYGPAIGIILGVCIIAPIVEEFYKVITVRFTDSQMPSFVTFVLEFIHYSNQIFGVAVAMSNPISMVGFIIVGAIVRTYALEMHMTTTQYYTADMAQFGHIRRKTMFAGMLLHSVWNLTSSMFAIIQGLIAIFPALTLYLGARGTVSIANIVNKVLKRDLALPTGSTT